LLHFLLHEEDRLTYFSTLKKVLKKGGFAIIAAFSLEGARKCSGLKVVNYNEKMLAQYLGSSFKLLETFYYTYSMPSGAARPYIYTLFQMEN